MTVTRIAALVAIGTALVLGGCGKKGNPKPPSATEQPEKTPTE